MDKIEQFFEAVKKDMTAILATACGESVTMRAVSPVCYQGKILIFTNSGSQKYRQLKENPNCCISVGGFFAQATAQFCGATLSEENTSLREAYNEKFLGAFDENVEFGGRDADFILLKPTRLTGWGFEDDKVIEDSIPTVPFDICL